MVTSYALVELSKKLSDGVGIEYTRFGSESVVTGHDCTGRDRTYQD
ncbi:hypothetical protein [Streptomyces sp. NPDC059788]